MLFKCFVHLDAKSCEYEKRVLFFNTNIFTFNRLKLRPLQITQCCAQFKFPGVKILCVLYLHYNVVFTFTAVNGMEISETKRFILQDTLKFSLHHKSTIFYYFLKKSLVPVLKTCALFCERQVAFFKCE